MNGHNDRVVDPLLNTVLGKGSGIMQYIELSPVAAFLLRVNIITAVLLANWCWYASILPSKDSQVALIDFAAGGNIK